MGGGIYVEHGTVSGNVVRGNSVINYGRGGGIYARDSKVSGNTVSENSSLEFGGGIYANSSVVSENTVSENSAFISGGGIYADTSKVTSNRVHGNWTGEGWSGGGGGIHAERNSVVTGNSVSRNLTMNSSGTSDGGGVYASHSTVISNTITYNRVFQDTERGAGACVSSGAFLYNTVIGNKGPLYSTVGALEIVYAFASDETEVHFNNLYGNEPYDVTVSSSEDVSGTNNYWGTAYSVDILSQIYDWYDDTERGKLLYVPYLQEPSEDAPLPPPTRLAADFQDDIAILSWDAHPSFTTGYGYKVYYDTDSWLPPYEGTGLNEGDSPIDVGDQTAYALSPLDPSRDYYFAVTVYDNDGHESWYSNVEWKKGGYSIYLPLVLKQ